MEVLTITAFTLLVLSPLLSRLLLRPVLRRRRMRLRWVVEPGPPPRLSRDRPSLERLVADLQRLEADLRRIESSDLPAKMQRLQAVSLAYDDVLCECCLALGLPEPAQRPFRGVDRLHAELELARHGLTW